MTFGSPRIEVTLALVVALLGIALTTSGALTHTGPAIAPGALLITLGGAWLGNALARGDVALVPGASRTPAEETE